MHRIRIAQPLVTGTCEMGTMYSCVRRIKTSGRPWTFPAPSTFLRRPLSPARPLIPTQNRNDAPGTKRSAPRARYPLRPMRMAAAAAAVDTAVVEVDTAVVEVDTAVVEVDTAVVA